MTTIERINADHKANQGLSIAVRIKDQYGAQVYVPDCNKAHIFANIANTKTLTPTAIEQIKKLGYVVHVRQTHQATL